MIHYFPCSSAKTIQENSISTFFEYPTPFESFSTGVSIIHGRYPTIGYDIDEGVDATWYIVSGKGSIGIYNDLYTIESGDMIFVPKGSPFFIDGEHLKLVVISSPRWNSDQHTHIDNL